MLKFQEQSEGGDIDQIRVSPQELVQALRTVEERKEAEARAHAETIPLGQAIQALGVNYTPEEVLEALQAHRAHRNETLPQRTVPTFGRRTVGGLVVVIVLMSGAILGLLHTNAQRSLSAVATPAAVLAPAPSGPVTMGLETKPLSQIRIGESFHCDTNTLLRLANGAADSNTIVEVGPAQNDLWLAMRGPAGLEVQGWTLTAEALKIANGQEATLYRSAEPFGGDFTSLKSVKIPLERLQNATSADSGDNYLTLKFVPSNTP